MYLSINVRNYLYSHVDYARSNGAEEKLPIWICLSLLVPGGSGAAGREGEGERA